MNEVDKVSHFRAILHFRGRLFQRLFQKKIGAENYPIGVLDGDNRCFRETAPLQPDNIEAEKRRPVAVGYGIGGYIFVDSGSPAHHRVGADTAELMNAGQSADKCIFFKMNVAGQRGGVGHNDIVL